MLRTFFWDIYADVIFASSILLYAMFHLHHDIDRYIGALLAIISIVLWVKARLDLGESYSVVPKAKTLVVTGLYSHIRHPMYLFSSLAMLGTLIALDLPLLYLFLPCYIAFQYFRIRKENALLRKDFGEARLRYEKRTLL